MFIRALKNGSFPFDKNDLTINQWLDVGIIETEIQNYLIRKKQHGA